MYYTKKALHEIEDAFTELKNRHIKLVEKLYLFTAILHNLRAKEYFQHGVLRRLFLINKCIENMFRIFPANREEKLSEEEHYDVEINLHCFLINIFGIIENIALSMAFENGIFAKAASEKSNNIKISLLEISLFKDKFRSMVSPKLKAYLDNSKISDWYKQYAKNYRDALAHRIPPCGLNKEERAEFISLQKKIATLNPDEYSMTINKMHELGKAIPFYVHSFSEEAKKIYLHPQIIADFRTVEELLYVIINNFKLKENA